MLPRERFGKNYLLRPQPHELRPPPQQSVPLRRYPQNCSQANPLFCHVIRHSFWDRWLYYWNSRPYRMGCTGVDSFHVGN